MTPEATPISKSAEQRAGQATEPADDDGDEARHDEIVADRRLQPEHADRKDAGEAGEIDAEPEIYVTQGPDIDAKDGDGFEIERAGADAQSEAGVVQDQKQAKHRGCDQRHHEHAIAGKEEVLRAQRRRERTWNLVRQALRSPNETRAVLDHEGQAERQQQTIERVAPVESPHQDALDQDADECDEEGRRHQRTPEAEIGRHRIGEITADRQETAMGEIDHAGQVEDQRQAQRHQRIECADDQPVKDIEQ